MKRLFLLLILAAATSAPVGAELTRLESVGVVPVRRGSETGAPRDDAVSAAVARGVERVAVGFLGARAPKLATTGKPTELNPALTSVLGSDPFEYVSRFRILRDRGTRPAGRTQASNVDEEYVVEAEVTVDAARVRSRLRQAGWLEAPAGETGARVRLVLDQLTSYAAYAGLRRTLIDDLGVRGALPVEFSPGRGVIEVDTEHSPAGLVAALEDRGDPNLRIVMLDQQSNEVRLLVEWTGPPPGPAAADDSASDN